MKETKNNEEKIQEFHILEQNLQNLLLQKQAFQMELSETITAKKEIEKSEEVFKVIGQLMIKSSPSEMKEELSNRENLLNIRLKSIEKQENSLTEKLEALRKEIF
ncbi:prefoldin subunit beta [Candidatus Pacearchaeota archaeon]|nr:prefoldin subunit beta [Candidatus Pacearchaeota archaeon]